MTSNSESPSLIAAATRALCDKFPIIIWFFVINIVVGATGVWVPLIPAVSYGPESMYAKFLEVLRSGGAYTFLLAYLASTSGYVITEYVEKSDQFFRSQKTIVLAIACVIGLLSAFLTMDIFSNGSHSADSKTATIADKIQIWMTIAAIVIGFLLALLQWAGAYTFDAFLDKSQEKDKFNAEKIMAVANPKGTKKPNEVVNVKGKNIKV